MAKMVAPRIFITGGHVSPALAVIEEIKRQKKNWEIIFVGRKTALEGSGVTSEEHRLVTQLGISFLPLSTGRLERWMTGVGLISLLKIPLGFLQALWYIARFRPELIVSFGGYVAAPAVLAGWLWGVPCVTHEQTPLVGLTNRLIGRFCRKIFVSFPKLSGLPKEKTIYTGLPFRQALFSPPAKPSFSFDGTVPLIYITGGTTGATTLNELLFPIIPRLLESYMVVHQTGAASFEKARQLKALTLDRWQHRYYPAVYFDTSDVAWIYKKAILVIGRSGANTVAEIALLGKVALLVPLPWSGGGEQTINAARLAQAGGAVMVDQQKVNSTSLENLLKEILKNRATFEKQARERAVGLPRDGAMRVVAELEKILAKP